MPSKKPKPWEPQPGETHKAYAGFCEYAKQPPATRAAGGKDRKRGYLGKPITPAVLATWSVKYNWVKRALAWDVERERISREVEISELRAMRRRQIRAAMLAQERAEQKLKSSVKSTKQAKGAFDELSETDAMKLLSEGAKLERTARGEPGEIIEERVATTLDVSNLTSDERLVLRRLRAKMAKKSNND